MNSGEVVLKKIIVGKVEETKHEFTHKTRAAALLLITQNMIITMNPVKGIYHFLTSYSP